MLDLFSDCIVKKLGLCEQSPIEDVKHSFESGKYFLHEKILDKDIIRTVTVVGQHKDYSDNNPVEIDTA